MGEAQRPSERERPSVSGASRPRPAGRDDECSSPSCRDPEPTLGMPLWARWRGRGSRIKDQIGRTLCNWIKSFAAECRVYEGIWIWRPLNGAACPQAPSPLWGVERGGRHGGGRSARGRSGRPRASSLAKGGASTSGRSAGCGLRRFLPRAGAGGAARLRGRIGRDSGERPTG